MKPDIYYGETMDSDISIPLRMIREQELKIKELGIREQLAKSMRENGIEEAI